jgi:hypothetical protein
MCFGVIYSEVFVFFLFHVFYSRYNHKFWCKRPYNKQIQNYQVSHKTEHPHPKSIKKSIKNRNCSTIQSLQQPSGEKGVTNSKNEEGNYCNLSCSSLFLCLWRNLTSNLFGIITECPDTRTKFYHDKQQICCQNKCKNKSMNDNICQKYYNFTPSSS